MTQTYTKAIGNGLYKLVGEEQVFADYTTYYYKQKKNHKKPMNLDDWLESTK